MALFLINIFNKPIKIKGSFCKKTKILFLCLFAIVFFCCNGNSQEKFENDYTVEFKRASLITIFENERFEYIFSSLLELDENWDQFIQDNNLKNIKSANPDSTQITVEIQIELSIGSHLGSFKGIITTYRKDIDQATKKLKAMLISASKS